MSQELFTQPDHETDPVGYWRFRVQQWKSYMEGRAISHGLYYSDPYGREHDLKHLRNLEYTLEQAIKKQQEKEPQMSELGSSLFDMMSAIGRAQALQQANGDEG